MKMVIGNFRLTGLIVPLLFASAAQATNGYFTHGVGTKSEGLAGSGSADPDEVLIVATNPAGLAFVSQRSEMGLEFFSPSRSYSTSSSLANGNGGAFTIGSNATSSDNKLFPIPYIASAWQLSPQNSFAAAFYGRGGMNTKWVGGHASFDPDGPGPAPVMTLPGTYGAGTAGVDLMQAFLNLALAHGSADGKFSLGGAVLLAAQRFEARGVSTFAGFTKTFAQSGGTVMPTSLSDNGHDMSYGAGVSVGVEWRPDPRFSAALAYTSKTYMSKFTHYRDLFAGGGKFDIPASATLSFTVKPTEPIALDFDVQRIWYSGIDSVGNPIENIFRCPTAGAGGTDVESCLGGSRGAGFGWEDMTVYKAGLRWQADADWTWRFGISHGAQPIRSSQMTFNVLAPGVCEDHVTLGLTRRNGERGEFNLALMYAPSKSVRGPNTFDPTQTIELKMHQFDIDFGYSWKH